MGNTKAEIALGRRITEARAAETRFQQEAFARKQQEERDAEEARRQEILALGRGYEIRPQAPQPEPAPEEERPQPALPTPSEVEIGSSAARSRKVAR
jgi:hypothetical protein